MEISCRAFLCLLLVVAPWLPAADAPLLPPLDGQLTGRFTATLLGGAPELEWKVQVQTTAPFERRIAFEASGRGLQVRGAAVLNPAGEGTWEISAAQIDLGEWFGWVGPQLGAVMSGVTVAGALQASGRGTWRGGKLGGSASLSLREGRLDDPGRTLLLEGISFDVDVADLAARRTEPAQVFTWRSGRFDVVPLGVGRIEFLLDGDRLSVNQAAIDVFGGELSTGSLVMSTSRPEFSVVARMQGIAFAPVSLSQASSRRSSLAPAAILEAVASAAALAAVGPSSSTTHN